MGVYGLCGLSVGGALLSVTDDPREIKEMGKKWKKLYNYSPEKEDRHEIVALVIVLSAILAGLLALIIWGFCV